MNMPRHRNRRLSPVSQFPKRILTQYTKAATSDLAARGSGVGRNARSRRRSSARDGSLPPGTFPQLRLLPHEMLIDQGQSDESVCTFFYRPALVLKARTVAGASARPAAKALSLTPFGGCGYDEVRLFGVFSHFQVQEGETGRWLGTISQFRVRIRLQLVDSLKARN